MSKLTDLYIHKASLQEEGKTKNRRDGYLLRVLLNSKITYRPHCPGTGGGAFFYVKLLKPNNNETRKV